MRDWPGRRHVEGLRLWPELARTIQQIESRSDLFAGALLIGSLSRGEGDAISDVDIVAVARSGEWDAAWSARRALSSDALVTFDRDEGQPGIAGHSWLTPDLVKVEMLITEPGRLRLAGNAVVLVGDDALLAEFERVPAFTRADVDAYSDELRETNAIPDVERAYGDLTRLLRRDVRGEESEAT